MSEKITMGKDNIKRLQKDIIDIIRNPLTEHGIYYSHDDSNMLKGYAVVLGPSDTIYRFGAYVFEFNFPTNYPYSPPKLKYMTNDGVTRFHPNLYRSGKVCISILNTWKGEQWTSCQTIRSVLLMLVTLFHNKPLLNEPGVKESSPSFKPYNEIITYKNLEIAVLRNVVKKNIYNDIINNLLLYHKKNVESHKTEIMQYITKLKSKKNTVYKTGIYCMKISVDYEKLYLDFENYFNLTKKDSEAKKDNNVKLK